MGLLLNYRTIFFLLATFCSYSTLKASDYISSFRIGEKSINNEDSLNNVNLLHFYWSSVENPEKHLFKFTTTRDGGEKTVKYWKITRPAKDSIKYEVFIEEWNELGKELVLVQVTEEIIKDQAVYMTLSKWKNGDEWISQNFINNEVFKSSTQSDITLESFSEFSKGDEKFKLANVFKSSLNLSTLNTSEKFIQCVEMNGVNNMQTYTNGKLTKTEKFQVKGYWVKGKGMVKKEIFYPDNPAKNSVTMVEMLPDPSFYSNKLGSTDPKYSFTNNQGYKFAFVDEDKAMEIIQNTANLVGGNVTSDIRISWWEGGEGEEIYENYYASIEVDGVHCMYEIPWAVSYSEYNTSQAYETGNCSSNIEELLSMFPQTKGYFSEGLETGLWIMYWQNGKVRKKTNYLNGKKNGSSEVFYETGELEASALYMNGQFDGESIFYFKNGSIKSKRYWSLGSKTGEWTDFDENGKVIRKAKFENGKLLFCEGACD